MNHLLDSQGEAYTPEFHCESVLEQKPAPQARFEAPPMTKWEKRIIMLLGATALAIQLLFGNTEPRPITPEKAAAAKKNKETGIKLDKQFRTPPNPTGGIPF